MFPLRWQIGGLKQTIYRLLSKTADRATKKDSQIGALLPSLKTASNEWVGEAVIWNVQVKQDDCLQGCWEDNATWSVSFHSGGSKTGFWWKRKRLSWTGGHEYSPSLSLYLWVSLNTVSGKCWVSCLSLKVSRADWLIDWQRTTVPGESINRLSVTQEIFNWCPSSVLSSSM